jgi:hypothetical protein
MPNIKAGHMINKNLAFMADARTAGVLVGARPHRADKPAEGAAARLVASGQIADAHGLSRARHHSVRRGPDLHADNGRAGRGRHQAGFSVPVCRIHHRELHRSGDAWWQKLNVDPLALALRLWRHTRAHSELASISEDIGQLQAARALDMPAQDRAGANLDPNPSHRGLIPKRSTGSPSSPACEVRPIARSMG